MFQTMLRYLSLNNIGFMDLYIHEGFKCLKIKVKGVDCTLQRSLLKTITKIKLREGNNYEGKKDEDSYRSI